MSFLQTIILGGISGLTIFIGMPLARLRTGTRHYLAFLNALAIGILFFLFLDVMENAISPVEDALEHHSSNLVPLLGVLIFGFGFGLLSLVYYGRRFLVKGAVPHHQVALLIALGVGLHNFSEGLAIGNSAQSGELHLAMLLIVGFGLHNITEAFGIAAPLAGQRTSWGFLGLLGLIGGGPNTLGTLIGYGFTSQSVSVLFLSLAGGALVFVIGELLSAGRKLGFPIWIGWGLATGFLIALLTDFLLISLGA